jgi:hypothetical protein
MVLITAGRKVLACGSRQERSIAKGKVTAIGTAS